MARLRRSFTLFLSQAVIAGAVASLSAFERLSARET
jgi:hypothetical protein